MPRGDGTGPMGQGAGSGRVQGYRRSANYTRMDGLGLGAGGDCICPKCGKRIAHQRGIPCNQQTCPECNTTMTRG